MNAEITVTAEDIAAAEAWCDPKPGKFVDEMTDEARMLSKCRPEEKTALRQRLVARRAKEIAGFRVREEEDDAIRAVLLDSAKGKRRVPTASADAGLTVKDLVRRLRVSLEKIRGWIRTGILPATMISAAACGRGLHVASPERLAEFLNKRKAAEPKTVKRRKPATGKKDYFPGD